MIRELNEKWARSTYLCKFTNEVTQLAINNNTFLNGSTQLVPLYTYLGDALIFDTFTVVNDVLFAKLAEQFLVKISHEIA